MTSPVTNPSRIAEPFAFQDALVKPGSVARLELPVARLPPGTWTSMPVVIIHGRAPGVTVWLSGAIHGDELNGVGIIRALIEQLDPHALCGTVIAVPVVNVFGAVQGSRYLPDRRDLNRSFPGSARGSLASRLAHLFFETVVKRCHFGIDFHTGSNGRSNLPHLRCNVDDPETRRLAECFASQVILHADLRDGSLRAAAAEAGIRVLLHEAGEALRFDRRAVDAGVDGTLRVFAALGLLESAPEAPAGPPIICRKSSWVRAHRSGFSQRQVVLGERVIKGQPVAQVLDSVGKSRAITRAKHAGVVIGCLETALVHRGDALVHIARPHPLADE